MQKRILRVFLSASLLTFGSGMSVATAQATAPSFTISAGNATMPVSGSGTIPFILTSHDGYAGTLNASCAPTSPPAGARLPYCGTGGPVAVVYNLSANATINETLNLSAVPVPLVDGRLNRSSHGAEAAWAFVGVLLFGFSFRRRRARWITLPLLAAAMLAGFMGLDACGGGNGGQTLTPGTYAYTITATDIHTQVSASTTINITVPPGIPAGSAGI